MITVQIGTESRSLSDASSQWINDQLNRRRRDNTSVCLKVAIHTDRLNIALQTPGCANTSSGNRQPNDQERDLLDLWSKRKLNTSDFQGGDVVAFLHQLQRFV
jgi:hypothetical protein